MDFSVITSEIDIRHRTRLEERERERERERKRQKTLQRLNQIMHSCRATDGQQFYIK